MSIAMHMTCVTIAVEKSSFSSIQDLLASKRNTDCMSNDLYLKIVKKRNHLNFILAIIILLLNQRAFSAEFGLG
jgi:hypothetical protein